MHKYIFPKTFIDRFKQYLSSKEFSDIPKFSKSVYWEYLSKAINFKIKENEIITEGESGYYIPGTKPTHERLKRVIHLLFNKPKKLMMIIREKLGLSDDGLKMLNAEKAFDAVMKHEPIAGIILNNKRINFKKVSEKKSTIPSMDVLKENYFAKHKYRISAPVIQAYYHFNILNGYINLDKVSTIMEIGAGNGNFASLFYHHIKGSKIIIVDLPETLCLSMTFISDLFPQANICFPHEFANNQNQNYDFIFLTPQQTHLIKDNCIDLAINTSSFQEMTHEQIASYFKLIQRVCKNEGHFFTVNRAEKIPVPENYSEKDLNVEVNRFSDFPWNKNNETLIYEFSPFHRIWQIEPIYIRLEKIKK